MRIGDLVERAGATIRGPNGKKKQLEEADHYGIVISVDPLEAGSEHRACEYRSYARVMWFDKVGNNTSTTIVNLEEIVKISR